MSEAVAVPGDHHMRTPIEMASDDDLAALIALAGLPSLTPSRLWALLELGPASQVWDRVAGGGAPRTGRPKDAADRWPGWSAVTDPHLELARHRQLNVSVLPFGHEGYPDALLDDPDPPAVIFRRGPHPLDDRVRVAIVGTRACTRYGRGIARGLGGALAQRGVDVVSGLATGIDAAAHAGAVQHDQARTVAVVAGGVDVVYPPNNRGLYQQIGSHGLLLSEWPLGASPAPWRFPARNRIVAALAAAVVVIESAEKGGSMYTVDEALLRNRAVFAVPGSIHSPASKGTNKLIADGAHALYDVNDLLDTVAPVAASTKTRTLTGVESWLLEAIGWEPVALDTVVAESGRSPAEVTLEVERLIAGGAIHRAGGVIERVA